MTILGPTSRISRRGWARMAAAAIALAVPATAHAQATLTLEEAIDLARRHNPNYRVQANDAADADWEVREAYGQFLPSFSIGNNYNYQAAGTPQVSGAISAEDLGITRTPSYYYSSYSLSGSMSLSGATFFQLSQARARRDATDARIDAAAYTLAADVTRQYLATLRARDNEAITASALESADQALRLAEARHAVGEAAMVDVSQAQVDRGRAEVAVLQAENAYALAKIRLLELLGVDLDDDFEPISDFAVFEPTWTAAELIERSLRSHPQLEAARANESAAKASSRAAKMSYLPSLSLTAGWSGTSRRTGDNAYLLQSARNGAAGRIENCEFWNNISAGLSSPLPGRPQNCSSFELSSADEQAILSANDEFPFNYTRNPPSISLSVRLPIWNGFSRERQMQSARLAAQDAEELTRAEELRRRTDVTTNLLALRTAFRTVNLEERNAEAAAQQLELAQERYRLGAGSILELTQAQEQKTRADQARLDAVYTFHETLAALEAAVGEQLRNAAGG